jgi:hypothetical protein
VQYVVRFHGSGAEANRRLRAAGFGRFNTTASYLTGAPSVPEFNYHRTVVVADSERDALTAVEAALGDGFAVFSAAGVPGGRRPPPRDGRRPMELAGLEPATSWVRSRRSSS